MKRFNDDNAPSNSTPTPTLDDVLERMARRDCLRLGLGALAVPFFGVATAAADKVASEPLFSFASVGVSEDDVVHVPPGYVAQVVYAWGDPVNGRAPQFKFDASNTAAEQQLQAGMGHDGMEWFPHPQHPENADRGLVCMNHEYSEQGLLYPDGAAPDMTDERVRKSQAAHGVSVIDAAKVDGRWQILDSKYARRITAGTDSAIHGPARAILGAVASGTVNNCACGKTPWGTYLTCEENFHSVFGTDDPDWKPTAEQKRYGLTAQGYVTKTVEGEAISTYRWWKHSDRRFDLARNPRESERFGYVVEIDPTAPGSAPKKRTALGRIKHENAAVTLAKDGRVVVYMGDDERNEYLYKFVSRGKYDPKQRAANFDLLDEGTLFVARLQDDKTGEWVELKPKDDSPEALARLCIHTRLAADEVKATPMDRPEWVAVHPQTGEVFVTLTNNDRRGEANQPAVNAANPRAKNLFGHILKWTEAGGDAAATTFTWDVFLLAGDPAQEAAKPKTNIRGDLFACPDGLNFDPRGFLWIQTDISSEKLGKKPFAELGNNAMLAADPRTGLVRRFLTGPRGCEVTGMTLTPDLKTMFVNIQHPGEGDAAPDPNAPRTISNWPDHRPDGRPRPATIAVFRLDGRPIGS